MSKKVLVVDDEKNIRMTLKQCITALKYEVITAVNGEDALNIVDENEDIDLILLDIKMPGLSGMKVLEKLRDNGNTAGVIMMTAYGTVDRAVKAMKLGAVDFISKPFTPSEIKEIIESVFNREELKEESLDTYKDYIEYAKKCIVNQDYNKAEELLTKSVEKDVTAPEAHNLLGVLAEYRDNVKLAQKHYRAALALDPTYKPADKNLERTAQFNYSQSGIEMGEEDKEEEEESGE